MSEWCLSVAAPPCEESRQQASEHTDNLTKPPGSLGMLERAAVELCAMQRSNRPCLNRIAISIFAADHGVAEEGVSAFPQAVTAEMVRNFAAGGAAISVLARQLEASFQVVNVGTVGDIDALPSVISQRINDGTRNFCHAPAMTVSELSQALLAGKQSVEQAGEIELFIGGEMGIANTTSAAALASALLNQQPDTLVGRGTGVDADGVAHKIAVIRRALAYHGEVLNSPLSALQCVGGFEIAALVGAYIFAAQQGITVLVDGFICTSAALAAVKINPSIRPWLMFSHQSAEAGHQLLLSYLQAVPLLQLDLRLGEGSGAAAAVPLLRLACSLHNEMASFDSAGVSKG